MLTPLETAGNAVLIPEFRAQELTELTELMELMASQTPKAQCCSPHTVRGRIRNRNKA